MLFNHYTTELRSFFENLPENADSTLPHSTVIENGRTKLFDFEYPIFDESYRKVFETHFIRNFYLRQIGFESFGLFKFQLETWLIINMPYFNKIFESELLEYDPLTNTKIDVTHNQTTNKIQNDTKNTTDNKNSTVVNNSTTSINETRTDNQSSSMTGNNESTQTKNETGSATDDNFGRQLESDNPDTRLAITTNDGQGVIEYASKIKENTENNIKSTQVNGTNTGSENTRVDSANKALSTNTGNNNKTDNVTSTETDTVNDTLASTINNVEDFIQHRFGKIGIQSFAKLVQEYRGSLLRVEKQIFDEMNELFMMVY